MNHYGIPASPQTPSPDVQAGPYVAAVVLAAALVFPGLGRHDFWLDEIFTLYFSGKDAAEILTLSRTGGESAPPFFYLMIHGMEKISQSEWVLRLPAALGAVAAAAMLFHLARSAMGNAAVWAALVSLCSSTVWLKHGQEVRMYSMLMALGGALFYLQWKCLRGEASRRHWVLYAACNAAVHALSYLGLLVLCVQLVALAASTLPLGPKRTTRSLAVRLAAVMAVSTFPLWPFSAEAFRRVALASPHFNIHPGPWVDLGFLYAKKILFPFPEAGMRFDGRVISALVADVAASSLLLVGAFRLWRSNRPFLVHACCWGAGAVAAAVWANEKGWMFEDRILSWLWLIPHLFVGIGFSALWGDGGGERLGRAAGAVLLMASVLLSVPSLLRSQIEPRQDWDGAIEYLKAEVQRGDRIVLTGTSAYPFSYYSCRAGHEALPVEFILLPGPDPDSAPAVRSGPRTGTMRGMMESRHRGDERKQDGEYASCELYASRGGQLRIVDGWMAACGLPFCKAARNPDDFSIRRPWSAAKRAAFSSAASSSDLFEPMARPGRTWIVREMGNQGLALWRGPWKVVLDRLAASSQDRIQFGRGESVEIFAVSRGLEGEPAHAEDHSEEFAVWPGGSWRRRVRATWGGRHDLTLFGMDPEPSYRSRLKGAGVVHMEQRTPLEVVVEVDGVESARKSVLPASVDSEKGTVFPFQMAPGEHAIELKFSPTAEAVLRSQQRAAPFSRIRLAFVPPSP